MLSCELFCDSIVSLVKLQILLFIASCIAAQLASALALSASCFTWHERNKSRRDWKLVRTFVDTSFSRVSLACSNRISIASLATLTALASTSLISFDSFSRSMSRLMNFLSMSLSLL